MIKMSADENFVWFRKNQLLKFDLYEIDDKKNADENSVQKINCWNWWW